MIEGFKHSRMILSTGIILWILFSFSCIHKKTVIHYCLASGTNVRLANGKDILIEKLKVGDTVMAFDRAKNIFLPAKVLRLAQTQHAGFVKLNFPAEEGISPNSISSLTLTNDHPIWVKDKGWCSLEPEMTKRSLAMKDVQKLVAGDVCFSMNPFGKISERKLVSVEKVNGIVKAYTIVQLENNLDCFFAGDIVVGTEPIQAEQGGE